MRLKYTLIMLILLNVAFLPSEAQQPLPKTLLWRITPPDGGKPSWLFGTMHLQDRSLFNFSDSVYEAISKSDKYAMELDPDTLVHSLFARLSGMKKKDDRLLKDQVDPKTWKNLAPYLKSYTDKDPADVTMDEAKRFYKARLSPGAKDDDMPTIVDLYLSLVAKDQGKQVTGLEKFADQSSLLDDMEDHFDVQGLMGKEKGFYGASSQMIKAYADGDLQKIQDIIASFDAAALDKMLVQRNRKMAVTMDSMARSGTVFFAVGCGHLPGSYGLIEAMRARGYRVDPVLSGHRLPPEHYTFRNRPSWQEYSNADDGWSISLPGRPFPVNVADKVDMTGYFDLSTMRFYFLTALPIGDMFQPEQDTILINGLKNSYHENSSIVIDSTRKITSGGNKRVWDLMGHDQASRYHLRLRVQIQDGRVFLVFLGGRKEREMSDESASKFFGSFQSMPVERGMKRYTDSLMGFSVLMPGKVKKVKTASEGTLSVYQYNCLGDVNGLATNVVVVSAGPDFVITSDSAYFRESIENMEKMGMVVLRRADTVVSGQHAIYLDFSTGKDKMQFENHLLSIRHGGRVYDLLSTENSSTASEEARHRFFSSLKILDPMVQHWSTQSLPGTDLQAWAPSPWTKKDADDENPHGANYQSYDSAASLTYNIYLDTLNKFVWATDDTTLLNHYLLPYQFKGQEESQRQYFRTDGGARCVSLWTSVEDSRLVKRVKLCLQGDRLLTAYTFLPDDWAQHEQAEHFFASVVPGPAADSTVLYSRSPGHLFQALRDSSSDVRDSANDALDDGRLFFSKKMFPIILDQVMKGYPEDSVNGHRIEEKLLSRLGEMTDSTTPSMIREYWSKMGKEQEHLRYRLLEMVTGLQTREAFSTLPGFLRDHLPTEGDAFLTVRNLVDTFALARTIWQDLLPFSSDSLFGGQLYRLHRQMVDSGYVSIDAFRKVFPLTKGALQAFEQEMVKDPSTPYLTRGTAIFNLLGRLNDVSSRSWLQRWVKAPNISGRMFAALELLRQGQPVDPSVWLSVARDKDTRLNLYEKLESEHKLNYFPKEYLNRRSLAESIAWARAEDDWEPKSMHFIKEVTTKFDGQSKLFLLYRMTVEDEDGPASYLVVVGPYTPESKELLPPVDEDISGVYDEDEYAPGLEMRQLAKYLKGFSSEKSR